ncbi:MAG: hypothetical protein MI861_23300 [Pirellulales bacterium]|nr:hypothetical protein [Pirellulales bacterium]
MHERTQRAIARLTFVFCCAVPTLATMMMILVTWTPWWHQRCRRQIQADLSRDTGMTVRIGDFQRAAPATLHLYDVEIVSPETQRLVAQIREVHWVDHGDQISILLQQPELRSAELRHTWAMIHDRFLCRPDRTSVPVQLAANDLTIQSRPGALTLRDVDAWIRPGLVDKTVEATIQCLPATQHGSLENRTLSPINISVTRDRNGSSPTTSWMLETGDTALPCSALAEYIPSLEQLGSDAMFLGVMRWTLGRDRWSVDLGGSRFSDLSLSHLMEKMPHRLIGDGATLELRRCHVAAERGETTVVDIAGSLHARRGSIDASLLRSAQRHLGFRVVPSDKPITYDLLALDFDLYGPRLQLTGICHKQPGHESLGNQVAICADGHPLAVSSQQVLPSTVLMSVMAHQHSQTIPLSRQTTPLLDILLPPSRSTPADRLTVPHISSVRPLYREPSISEP